MSAGVAPSPPQSATPHALVVAESLSKRFGGLLAIDGVSFEIRAGEITALIGPNGAGKTTVFNCLTGFYKPTAGRITAHTRGGRYDLAALPAHKIGTKARLARTFQNIRLFKRMSVLENCLAAQHRALMRAARLSLSGFLGLPGYARAEKQAVERAKHWLNKLELLQYANDDAGGLPYGAQRRLEIARALCMEPELLCLDEPAAGLNPKESAALASFLQKLRDEEKTSVLLIEHDMSVVMGISDHVVVLNYGAKIADGSAAEVRANKEVIKAYLGEEDAAA